MMIEVYVKAYEGKSFNHKSLVCKFEYVYL